MIVEERIYDLHPGRLADYKRIVETESIAIQRPILGRLIGYFHTEIGDLNRVVHLWAYESLADRAARRAKLLSDPRWIAVSARAILHVARQHNRILLPFAFSPGLGECYVAPDADLAAG